MESEWRAHCRIILAVSMQHFTIKICNFILRARMGFLKYRTTCSKLAKGIIPLEWGDYKERKLLEGCWSRAKAMRALAPFSSVLSSTAPITWTAQTFSFTLRATKRLSCELLYTAQVRPSPCDLLFAVCFVYDSTFYCFCEQMRSWSHLISISLHACKKGFFKDAKTPNVVTSFSGLLIPVVGGI